MITVFYNNYQENRMIIKDIITSIINHQPPDPAF